MQEKTKEYKKNKRTQENKKENAIRQKHIK